MLFAPNEEGVFPSVSTPRTKRKGYVFPSRKKQLPHEETQITMQDHEDQNIKNSRFCLTRICCVSNCACVLGIFALIAQLIDTHSAWGSLVFRIFGIFLYIIDVTTDIISGASFISGANIDYSMFGKENFSNYTNDVCQDYSNYSHGILGSLNILYVWVPVFTLLPVLTTCWKWDGYSCWKYIPVLIVLVIFWPIVGIFL